jgi:hypothetical protein
MKVLAAIAVIVCALIAAYVIAYPTYTYRYRLIVEVEFDGQSTVGSSVVEVQWSKQPQVGSASPWNQTIKGQAAFVDLGNHGCLIATLFGAEYFPFDAFLPAQSEARTFIPNEKRLQDLKSIKGKALLRGPNYPLVLWLPDRNKPGSARGVPTSNLPVEVSGSVKLLSIAVQVTSDPLSTDLNKKIPWLRTWAEEQKKPKIPWPPEYALLPISILTRGIQL